jgi:hypothetical protein
VEAVIERDAEVSWLGSAVEPIPWRGPRRLEQAALALVAIAHHESGLRESVARCWRTGDDGRSVSVFQLHVGRAWGRRSRRELCSSHRIAARQAMAVLASAGARGTTPRSWFDGYASGDTRRRTRAGGKQHALFERLLSSAQSVSSAPRSQAELHYGR